MAGPPRLPFPSAPSEPRLRRLGVGGRSGGSDRPLRAQLVVALVGSLIVLAVPLYLWRRPSAEETVKPDAEPVKEMASQVKALDAGEKDAEVKDERVKLGEAQKVKCSASRAARGQEGALCDSLPFFEESLKKAIRDNVECAPRTGKPGTLNYVLDVDFTRKTLHVFPGASGEWKGPQARRSAQCVFRSLPQPKWQEIRRQYRFYRIAIMASYMPPKSPMFE